MADQSNFPLTIGERALAADIEQIRKNPIGVYTYGEALTAGQAVYLKASDGKIYKTDATTAGEACYAFLGYVLQSGSANDTGAVSYNYSGDQSGLTINADYFLTNTGGAISTTPGTNIVFAGRAISTTEIRRDYNMMQPVVGSVSPSVSGSGTSFTTDDDSNVLTLVLPRACRVALFFSGQETSRASNAQVQNFTVSFNIDNDTTIITGYSTGVQTQNNTDMNASCSAVTALLSAGSHTFRMRVAGSSSSSMNRGISGILYAVPLT